MGRKRNHEETQTRDRRRTRRSTTATDVAAETSAVEPAVADEETNLETEAEQTEVVETSMAAGQTVGGPATDEATGEADVAEAEQTPAGDAQPEAETAAALALRRWRERPTCCCGCGQVLSSPKKCFIQGHDGRAKSIVRKIMRGELQPQEAPTELILRHMEIKFITHSPEFRRVVELWREMCSAAHGMAAE